jgi:transcriptional antiterminator RfaH
MVNKDPVRQSDPGTAKWYAVKTRPRQEHIALRNLENQGYMAYLPYLWLNRRHRGQWQWHQEVLFPGYLFICVDTASQNVAPVRSTLGVIGLVRFGDHLVSIDKGIIQHLKAQEAIQATQSPVSPLFKPGDRLTITGGPMAGISAVFHMEKSTDRVMVLVNILGGTKPVAVDINSVVPAQQ